MTELMISIVILAIVVGMVIPATIYYGRAVKSQNFMQRSQQKVNLFNVLMNDEMLQASTINLVNSTTVTFASNSSYYITDPNDSTQFTYRKDAKITTITYVDGDNNPDTINDNRLLMSYVTRAVPSGTVIEQVTNEVLLENVSPMIDPDDADETFDPFVLMNDGARPYIRLRLKVGDRDTPTKDAWDRYTGPGYQGFVVDYLMVPYNVSSVRTS